MGEDTNSVQIIPYYAHPHVFTKIFDNTYYDETVANPERDTSLPFATVVVTGADSGIDNTFVRLDDLKTKQTIFGKGDYQKYGQASLQADMLFNGSTSVWFCRVLPDNATYANMILLAHYREGVDRDDLDHETGFKRLEIKFSVVSADKPKLTLGATDDDSILSTALSLATTTADPQTNYNTVPLCYIRSIGRGRYGNQLAIAMRRDTDAEKEYDMKMYKWALVTNSMITRVSNIFSGSMYQTTKYNMSTLISDVLDQFSTGSCPIKVHVFEDNFIKLFNVYKEIVKKNGNYLNGIKPTDEQAASQKLAESVDITGFDPLFGYVLGTRADEIIPYYKNYTVKSDGPYVPATACIPTWSDPEVLKAITNFNVGDTLEVASDSRHGGMRWRYTLINHDPARPNIVADLDEGYECHIDDKEYDGTDIADSKGVLLSGGSDGDFEAISVKGVERAPTNAEMKLLLAREQVKAFHGEKDRKILSPARTNVDFIFDANLNMTTDNVLELDDTIQGLYSNSTVLTDEDYRELGVLAAQGNTIEFSDLNVKRAMYDLVEFRNRNGMTVDEDMGAGCSLYLDCGLVGLKTINASTELLDIIGMFSDFQGRAHSIDLGSYEIFDPYTGRREPVTVTFFIAQNLVSHIMSYGLNKPFTYGYAALQCLQRSSALTTPGAMIRDTFKPDIDLIDWDVKETLFTQRINYYLTTNEGRTVERACQNTRQMDASALLEENNVRVLNTLKKGLEASCRGYLYNWNEPEARKGYTDSQMAIYRPWIGTMVQDIQIKFDANEWEQERMILHCYCVVKFRDIVKRIILEINIQRPEY